MEHRRLHSPGRLCCGPGQSWHAVARFCQLTEEEVLALRFYSTAGVKSINRQDLFYILKIIEKVLYMVSLLGI